MPSFKYKYEQVKEKIDIMENRILISEEALIRLQEEIESLKLRSASTSLNDGRATYMNTQLVMVINEIEELCLNKKNLPATAATSSPEIFMEQTVHSLQKVAKMLRDSHVRAQTLTGNISRMKRNVTGNTTNKTTNPTDNHKRTTSEPSTIAPQLPVNPRTPSPPGKVVNTQSLNVTGSSDSKKMNANNEKK
nr:hypothetical protein [Diaporthe negative-stranded RNA virus 1]